MGFIRIQVGGSFDASIQGNKDFGAMDHGHADAVAQAIEYLASTVLPKATAQDHQLQADGHNPRGSFTRPE